MRETIDMDFAANPPTDAALLRLRQFTRKRTAAERCELCSCEVPADHEHLVDPLTHTLVCSCLACATLFDAGYNAKYKRVPRSVRFLQDFQITAAQWESLRLPIDMAFFFRSTPKDRVVALYPSPAGAVESLLPFDTWDEVIQVNPVLKNMQADVAALLVNRIGSSNGSRVPEYFLVPIDECYKLVGLIRANWRGLSGGTEVWREVAAFFGQLKRKSGYQPEAANA
jgi:Family of unknown function (DUF5947)